MGAYKLARGDGIYVTNTDFSNSAAIYGASSSGNQLQVTAGIKHEF